MELQHINLDKLYVSKLNMRCAEPEPDVSDILPNILKRGVRHPLIIRDERQDGTYGIIAGRRRFCALKTVREKDAERTTAPCVFIAPGDDAEALEASLIENIGRADPDPMNQYETFCRLIKQGQSVGEIAETFGFEEAEVRKALALGDLAPEIRQAYKKGGINAGTLKLLTLATKRAQRDWYKLFKDPKQNAPLGANLKQWLFGGREISESAALFSLDQYKGKFATDLFDEDKYFLDTEQFWRLQDEAIAAACEEYHKKGWPEVVVLDRGAQYLSWQYIKTPKSKGGRVYAVVSHSGEVEFHEGYLPEQEVKRRARANALKEGKDDAKATNPEISSPMQDYIELHRHAAVRVALLNHSGVALRLIAAHLISSSHLWDVTAEPQRSRKAEVVESIRGCKAEKAFEAARAEIRALLGFPKSAPIVEVRSAAETSRLLATLVTLSDEEILKILTFLMSETLQAGGWFVEFLGAYLKVDMMETWQPEDLFFNLLRDKGAVNAIVKEVAGKRVADGNVSAPAKTQKKIIRDCLTGEGRKKVEGWTPRYMRFPFAKYTKRQGIRPEMETRFARAALKAA